MQNFVVDIYSKLNRTVLDEFQLEIQGVLPAFSSMDDEKSASRRSMIYKRTEHGLYTANSHECLYFTNDGSIHIVNMDFDRQYYDTYEYLYKESLNDTVVKFCQPMEWSQHLIAVDDHISGWHANTPIYYMHLQTPGKKFGRSLMTNVLMNRQVDFEQYLTQYIDEIRWIFQTLSKSNCKFPGWIDLDNRLENDEGVFYTGLPKFEHSIKQALDLCFAELDSVLLDIPRRVSYTSPDLLDKVTDYARTKWLPLIN